MKLSAKLRDNFGPQRLIGMGNASARVDTPHHSPTVGIELRLPLKRLDFIVAVVDKFRTPKCCPSCHSELHISRIRSDRCALSGGRNSISKDRRAKSQNKKMNILNRLNRSLRTFLSLPSPRPWLGDQRARRRHDTQFRQHSERISAAMEDRNTYVDKTQGRRAMIEGLGEDDDAAFKRVETHRLCRSSRAVSQRRSQMHQMCSAIETTVTTSATTQG